MGMRLRVLGSTLAAVSVACVWFAAGASAAPDPATEPGAGSAEYQQRSLAIETPTGFIPIDVLVPQSTEALRIGLSRHPVVAEGTGMLFDFAGQVHCLWMRDTDVPLSAAFVDRYGRIVSIQHLVPRTTRMHCVPSARWAIEVPWGWFERSGIEVGMTVRTLGAPIR